MIPLVDYEQEIEIMRELVVRIGDEEGLTVGEDYTVGTMIELPRACFVADRIAKFADFFSFHRAGLNYVSCSPFRVPIARIAAAQAAIEYPIGRWD